MEFGSEISDGIIWCMNLQHPLRQDSFPSFCLADSCCKYSYHVPMYGRLELEEFFT